jgi:hypothetical protein
VFPALRLFDSLCWFWINQIQPVPHRVPRIIPEDQIKVHAQKTDGLYGVYRIGEGKEGGGNEACGVVAQEIDTEQLCYV